MELHATGFNAWNQLRFAGAAKAEEPDDLYSFTYVLKDESIRAVRPFLSYTAGTPTPGSVPNTLCLSCALVADLRLQSRPRSG